MNKTILIIGGSGLIGKPLVKEYLENNKVINLDIKNFKLNDKNYYYEKIDLNKDLLILEIVLANPELPRPMHLRGFRHLFATYLLTQE